MVSTKLTARAIINFPGSQGYSLIKNLLALPITHTYSLHTKMLFYDIESHYLR